VLKRLTVSAMAAGLVLALTGFWSVASAGSPRREPGIATPLSAWKNAYKNDTHCNPTGHCFGALVHNTADGTVDEYLAVESTRAGRVYTYDQAFPVDTSATTVEKLILRTLPSDATATEITLARAQVGTCGQLNIRSRTVGKELGEVDQNGEVGVEFFDGTSGYDASNVQDAIVTDAASTPGKC
jgi:hypothetical protein